MKIHKNTVNALYRKEEDAKATLDRLTRVARWAFEHMSTYATQGDYFSSELDEMEAALTEAEDLLKAHYSFDGFHTDEDEEAEGNG